VAPVVIVNGGFEDTHVAFALGGLWIPEQTLGVAQASVSVQLIAAEARACALPWIRVRVGLCLSAFGGAVLGSSQGFNVDSSGVASWFAAGIQAFFEGRTPLPALRYRLAVGAIAPLQQEVFTVGGAGSAYDTPPVGGLVTLAIDLGSRPPVAGE
jgi:hypothetical protein